MPVKAKFDFRNKPLVLANDEMVRFIEAQEGKKNLSEATVYKYALGLEEFSHWLEEEDLTPTEVNFGEVERYLSYLTNEQEYADKTVGSKVTPVSLFYQRLVKSREISENPVEKVDISDYADVNKTKKESETGKKRVFLSKKQVDQLAENAPSPKLRNRLLILFMYYTGLRRSEVSRVKRENLDLTDRTVEVEVKGGDKHKAVYHDDIQGLLKQWLDYGYRDSYLSADESPYLFVSRDTERLSGTRIGRIVDKAAQNAGLQKTIYEDATGREHKKITCHTLRHSYAMNFLNDGGTFEALSNRLAHSSIKTTEIYGEVEDERGIDEYEEVMEPVGSKDEQEEEMCILCGREGNLQKHHISHTPPKVISVCGNCKHDIETKAKYEHLRPEESENTV